MTNFLIGFIGTLTIIALGVAAVAGSTFGGAFLMTAIFGVSKFAVVAGVWLGLAVLVSTIVGAAFALDQ